MRSFLRLFLHLVMVGAFVDLSTGNLTANESFDPCCFPESGECGDRDYCRGVIKATRDDQECGSSESCEEIRQLQHHLKKLRKLSAADFTMSFFAVIFAAFGICEPKIGCVAVLFDLIDFGLTVSIAVFVQKFKVVEVVGGFIGAQCFNGVGNEVTLYQTVGQYDNLAIIAGIEAFIELISAALHVIAEVLFEDEEEDFEGPALIFSILGFLTEALELVLAGYGFFAIVRPSEQTFNDVLASFENDPAVQQVFGGFEPCILSCCNATSSPSSGHLVSTGVAFFVTVTIIVKLLRW